MRHPRAQQAVRAAYPSPRLPCARRCASSRPAAGLPHARDLRLHVHGHGSARAPASLLRSAAALPLTECRAALRRIQAILVQHIKKRLPELRTEVATLEREKRGELRRLGTSVANGSTDFLRETMIRQLTQYSRNFSDGLQARPARLALACF